MGNLFSICSGSKSERRHENAFSTYESSIHTANQAALDGTGDVLLDADGRSFASPYQNNNNLDGSLQQQQQQREEDTEFMRQQLEEQARLDALVIETSRGMTPVNKGPMITQVYDPNYAAAISQELYRGSILTNVKVEATQQQSSSYAEVVAKNIKEGTNEQRPSVSFTTQLSTQHSGVSPSSVIEILSSSRWKHIHIGSGNEQGASASPDVYFDECAESFMASVLPYALFKGAKPIVENL